MVVLPNCDDMRSPSSAEGRRIMVAHRLPLGAVPNPDAPYGFNFSLDKDAVEFKHPRGLPGQIIFVGTLPAAAASVPASEELAAHLLERFSCCPVFLSAELHKDFCHGFCSNLWPKFHYYLPFDGGRGIDFQEKAYIAANKAFAERVLELLTTPDADCIYIHDYHHLLMLPGILRKQTLGIRAYFTLHSPFPSSAIFCSSRMGRDMLCSLLSADSVAFVCFDCARHFLSSCTRLLNIPYVSTRGDIKIHYLERAVVVRIIATSSGRVSHLHQMLSLPAETGAKARDISTRYVVATNKTSTYEGFFSGTSQKPLLSTHNNLEYHKIDKYRSILEDHVGMVSSQGLNKSSTLEVFKLARKKMLISEPLFTWLLLENLDGKHRSYAQDYDDTVSPQGLNKATTHEKIQLLEVLCLDPNNIRSFISGRRNDISIILPALHKLMSADHGYFISSQRKNSTFSKRIPSYLAQLVAACSSSASAGRQSGMALLHPSRRPPIRFLLDSGASLHVVGDAGLLHHFCHLTRAEAPFATLPDGSRKPMIGVGTIQMDGFSIPNVYLVEGLTVSLVSVSRLATEHGICCCFLGNRCQLMLLADRQIRVVGEAVLGNDGVYGLRFLRIPGATA